MSAWAQNRLNSSSQETQCQVETISQIHKWTHTEKEGVECYKEVSPKCTMRWDNGQNSEDAAPPLRLKGKGIICSFQKHMYF
jgi:hypothetical protein